MNNNGCIIPEIDEQNIGVQQENATFLVIGDEAYTSEIIEEYNRNAAAKTEEFNTNATNKTNDFNKNYDNKIKAFNSNAVTKTEDFDSHVTAQTTNFNNNAETATTNFNRNAVQQTDEFNRNAMSYSQGIEENKKNIASTSNELYHLKTDILETGESSGNNIHLEDSAWAEMQEIKVDGVCEQNTTTGKNKLDLEFSNESSTLAGMTFSHTKSEFTLNGTATGTWGIFTLKNNLPIVDGKTYSLSANIKGKNPKMQITLRAYNGSNLLFKIIIFKDNNYKNTATASFTDEITRCEFVVEGLVAGEVYNLTAEVQFEENSTPTDYEPYTGGQPSPSSDYPQEIKTITDSLKITSCGKNLFSSDSLSTWKASINRISKNEFELTSAGDYSNANIPFMKLKKYLVDGQEYTLSANFDNPNGNHIGFNIINVSSKYTDDLKGTLSMSFTYNSLKMPSIYLYANASYDSSVTGTVKYYNVMLTNKSLSDNYEDYVESQIQAKLPEGEFIGYINAINYDALSTKYNSNAGAYQLVLNKCIAKITIDGTKGSFSMPSAGRFNIDNIINDYLKTSQSYGITTKCDNYISFPETLSNSDFDKLTSGYNYGIGLGAGTANNIRIKNVNFSNIEDFKNDLKQHPITLYYISNIESRRTLDLGVIDMPLTYDEITNIFTDSDLLPTINVKYYRNFTATIQNLQVNNDTLKNELSNIESRLTALESANTNIESRLTTLENANKNVADSNPTEESEVTE